jgi:hypothetical protein
MIQTTTRPRAAVAAGIRILVLFEAATFLLAALLHAGVALPVGFAEPPILPAAIVEGLLGLFFAVNAFWLFAHWRRTWHVTVAAHAFALVGVLLGLLAMTLAGGTGTEANDIYHRVMLVVIVAALTLLVTPIGRTALGQGPITAPEK